MLHTVFIGLGSNQGEKIKNCERAIAEIISSGEILLVSRSSWHRTEPWGREDQEYFINGAIQVQTDLSPEALFSRFQEIEKRLGRTEGKGTWGPRVIDIDILFYDDHSVKLPELEIPHPRIPERNFVLIPLAEIAPQFIHPKLKKTIQDLADQTSDQKKVIPIPREVP